jgi:glycosyltransferase involved in cell wall biosynthesis
LHTLACIPAFNEEGVIGIMVKETLRYVDNVVVCDDGSFDNTSKEAETAGAYVIKNPENLGKGSALKSLFKYAKSFPTDIIITIDGDGQFLPKEIPKLCQPIIENIADIVIGYRFDGDEMPKYRKVGNKLLDKISNYASNLPLRDTQSGFRAYTKNSLNSIDFDSDGFTADSEILISASKNDMRFAEEKVSVLYNTGRRTSTKNPISHASGVIASLIETILIQHPLKFLGIPGIFSLVIGMISSIYTISLFNEIRYFSIPLSLLSVVFLSLGLLFVLVSGLLYAFQRQLHSR